MKKLSKSRAILDDNALSRNLRSVLEYSGMTQAEFADALGIKPQAVNGYLWNRDNRKAINLYPKLVEMGISGDWYLTGMGPMLISEVKYQPTNDNDLIEAGRKIADAIQFMIDKGIIDISGTNYPSASSTRAERSGAERSGAERSGVELSQGPLPKLRPKAGPSPDLTPEQYEELVRLRSGDQVVSRSDR